MEIAIIAPMIAAINTVDRHAPNNVSRQRVDCAGNVHRRQLVRRARTPDHDKMRALFLLSAGLGNWTCRVLSYQIR